MDGPEHELRAGVAGVGGGAVPHRRLLRIGGIALIGPVEPGERDHRRGIALPRRAAQQGLADVAVPLDPLAAQTQQAEIVAGARIADIRRALQQRGGLRRIARHALANQIHQPKRQLRRLVILLGGGVVPGGAGGEIDLDPVAVGVVHPETELRGRVLFSRGAPVPLQRLGVIDLAAHAAGIHQPGFACAATWP